MNVLFIAKPVSKSSSGVVSALINEVKYLQNKVNLALYNIGVELDKEICHTVYNTSYTCITSLPEPFNKPDLVVFEEVYKIEYAKLYKECLKNKIPYVIIPHGCLVQNEQNKKRFKHMVANILLFNRFIKKARAIEFLNEGERKNSHFKYRDYVIIPNSIEIEERKYDIDQNVFKFIYIGRYDVVTKGLDLLLNTFISMKDWCEANNVVLELYGPNSESLTSLFSIDGDYIKINGPIYGEDKAKALQSSRVFIQTSRNEAQPMGIMEALSYGVPCLVTYNTNFGEYCDQNVCGKGINFSSLELQEAIKEMYNHKDELSLYSRNAVSNVKKDFEINAVTDFTIELYKKLI